MNIRLLLIHFAAWVILPIGYLIMIWCLVSQSFLSPRYLRLCLFLFAPTTVFLYVVRFRRTAHFSIILSLLLPVILISYSRVPSNPRALRAYSNRFSYHARGVLYAPSKSWTESGGFYRFKIQREDFLNMVKDWGEPSTDWENTPYPSKRDEIPGWFFNRPDLPFETYSRSGYGDRGPREWTESATGYFKPDSVVVYYKHYEE